MLEITPDVAYCSLLVPFVMRVAVLTRAIGAARSYASPQVFTDGLVATLPIGAAALALGALAALFVPEIVRDRPAGALTEARDAHAAAVAVAVAVAVTA